MKYLAILALVFTTHLFAVTPFSLENLSSVNFKILNKNKALDKQTYADLNKTIMQRLNEAGIKTKTKSFANFLIKVKTVKLKDITACHVTLFLVEDVQINRDNPTKAIAITYSKDDFFESSNVQEDLQESIEFLVDEFLSQYEDEK